MKIILVLMLCGFAAAAYVKPEPVELGVLPIKEDDPKRNIMDQLLPIVFELLRLIMLEGYPEAGIPILDPLQIDELAINLPAGLINLNLHLKDVHATGASGFEVHSASMDIIDLTFSIDVSVPTLYVNAGYYDLVGDLFTAIPIYGTGTAVFKIDGFRFRTKIYFGQSEDERSIIIDQLANVGFAIPSFKAELTGAIGGGDIDNVVNAVINEVIIDYVMRFERYISSVLTTLVPTMLNPILNRLDSWEFIDNFDRP